MDNKGLSEIGLDALEEVAKYFENRAIEHPNEHTLATSLAARQRCAEKHALLGLADGKKAVKSLGK